MCYCLNKTGCVTGKTAIGKILLMLFIHFNIFQRGLINFSESGALHLLVVISEVPEYFLYTI